MLLALACLALVGIWWLGRNGTLPFGLTPKRIYSYAVFAVAAALALRGSLVLGGAVALGGIWLIQGKDAVARRLSTLFGGPVRSATYRTASVEFEGKPGQAPSDGLVLVGPSTEMRLSGLPIAEIARLLALCAQGDREGGELLEAYLDRRRPGWRVDAERDGDARPGAPLQPGTMTEEEAYQVLGLERGAPLDRIRAAHRLLMKRLHPDQGGSAERAARVNAARDRLLGRHR